MSCEDRCEEAACYGCYTLGQRETIARVVAWLRDTYSTVGTHWNDGRETSEYVSTALADALERGDWKEKSDG